MARRLLVRWLVVVLIVGTVLAHPASAQITTGTAAGTVRDEQGLPIPGATVTLVNEARGTKMAAVFTGATGEFVVPNLAPDTYTVEVALDGFHPVRRAGVVVGGGDRINIGALTLTVGSASETVTVTAESPLIQTQSGERSFAISAEAVQAIAVNGRNYNNLTTLAPGVVAGTVNGLRVNQNTLQIDGITSVDTGNNGNAVTLSVDAVQEVKVLTSSYQAEYGRSAGAQISAVTKSGSQQFRGSLYTDRRRDDLNSNTWLNEQRGLPKQKINQSDQGYTIGGPIDRRGSGARLFFFLNQEFQQVLAANNQLLVRVPTDLERRGDFSQTRDNAGRLFNLIRNPASGLPCTAANTSGCFADGGVLGRIPQSSLYNVGLAVLNMYPQANSSGTLDQGYNYTSQDSSDQPRRQDLVRIDWQASSRWRVNGKWLHTGGNNITPYGGGTTGFGTNIPEFGSTNPCPCNRQFTIGVSGTLSNSLVTEIFYGSSNRPITNYALNTANVTRSGTGLTAFPMIFPNAVQLDYVPSFVFSGSGSRVANAPTNNTQYAPFENNNTSQDFVASLTKLQGSHTLKTGFFLNRAVKEQSSRAAANGIVSFANDASNPLDTGFPFANAALGVYQSYTQAADWIKGNFVYDNVEWYAQDNWRATSHLTLDYGMRFYWLQPTYDTRLQASNFLPDQFDPAKAPRLYYPGLNAAGVKVGIDRATGATVPAINIGRLVPGSGSLIGNGLFGAGQGIDPQLYQNRGVHFAPRFGFAYDVGGEQQTVIRGGFGVFYDRAAGDTVYGMIEQPPTLNQPNLFYGRLQDITAGAAGTAAPPTISAFEFSGKIPTVYSYHVGVQKTLRGAMLVDLSFVGSQSRNLNTQVNLNAPAYGAAYLPQNQDPTVAASTIPGATALPVDFLRPYRGFGDIIQITPTAYADYKSFQASLTRRFSRGVSFNVNYTLGKAMGTSSTDFPAGNNTYTPNVIGMPRTDSEANQRAANYMPLSTDRRHTLVSSFVWQLPNANVNRLLAGVIHDWQVSGSARASSGQPYTVTYNIPGVSPYTITGTQRNESGRIVITGDPGSGYGDDPYQQFNPAAFTTPKPGSLGLESGTNYLNYQPQYVLDLSVARFIKLGTNRRFEMRIDAFNAFNTVTIIGVNNSLQVRSLTDPTPTNLSRDSSGNLINATGFGSVSAVAPARQIQLMARFHF